MSCLFRMKCCLDQKPIFWTWTLNFWMFRFKFIFPRNPFGKVLTSHRHSNISLLFSSRFIDWSWRGNNIVCVVDQQSWPVITSWRKSWPVMTYEETLRRSRAEHFCFGTSRDFFFWISRSLSERVPSRFDEGKWSPSNKFCFLLRLNQKK